MNASRIQHNIASMNSYRNYTNNSNKLGANLEKLSSGYKINRAGDDAAGLAISEKMRAQITGLEVAQKNAKDGISVVQTAEGALTEVHDMLNRMYSLAEQSANGIYTTTERQKLQDEVDALSSEIDRISQATNFNGIALLNGKLAGSTATASGVSADASAVATLATPGEGVLDPSKMGINGTTGAVAATLDATYVTATTASVDLTVNVASTTGTSASVNFGDIAVCATISYDYDGTAVAKDWDELVTEAQTGGVNALIGFTVGGIALTASFAVTAGLTAQQLADAANAAIKAAIAATLASATGLGTAADFAVSMGGFAIQADGSVTNAGDAKILYDGAAITASDKTAITTRFTGVADGDFNDGADAGTVVTIGTTTYTTTAATLTTAQLGTAITTLLGAAASDWDVDNMSVSDASSGDHTINLSAVTAGDVSAYTAALETAIGSNGFAVAATGSNEGADYTVTIGSQKFELKGGALSGALTLADANTASTGTISINVGTTVTSSGVTANKLGDVNVSIKDSSLVLQIGDDSNTYNQLRVAITSMGAENLFGVSADTSATDGNGNSVSRYVDIMDADKANTAMSTIKAAIEKVSVTRGNLGAIQNRLEHTINNLGTTRENLQDAESAIRDTDVAEEMMKYTKNSIMNQAAQAMLAQANQLPQGVLQLLQ